jgi:hypothetical protein
MKNSLQGLTKKWHGLPIWAWAVVAAVVLYFGYRWYKNRTPAAAANPAGSGTATAADPNAGSTGALGGLPGSGDSGGGGGTFTPTPSDVPLTGQNPVPDVTVIPGEIPTIPSNNPVPAAPAPRVGTTAKASVNPTTTAKQKAPRVVATKTIPAKTGASAQIPGNLASDFPTGVGVTGYGAAPVKAPVTAKSTPAPVKIEAGSAAPSKARKVPLTRTKANPNAT